MEEILPPGSFIRSEMEARGWGQADLARILNRPLPTVNEIILGKRAIIPEMAVALGTAFGNGAEIWMQREGSYRLSLVEMSVDPEVQRRAKLYEFAPVKDMERRGWIKPTGSLDDLERELCRFFEVPGFDEEPTFLAATRKTAATDPLNAVQRAWCVRGARLARTLKAEKFDSAKFEKELPGLRALAAHPEQSRDVPKALASLGVRLVIIEPLQRSRIDGAAFWLDRDRPVVLVSIRYDRIDGFWHTLAHELMHIKHRDLCSVDSDMIGEGESKPDIAEIELRANREASSYLVPKDMLDSFVLRVKPLYSKTRIIQFAHRARIHPGIVTGQLQHRREIGWQANREMLVKVRDIATSTTLTDGWGHTAPPI